MNGRNTLRVGIDLGTTNTCCYCERNGIISPLHTKQGGYILPSYVLFQENGKISVGSIAKDKLDKNVKGTYIVHNSKRVLGKDFEDPSVQQLKDSCGVPIINQRGKPVFKIGEERVVTPKEVATEIIKAVLEQVRAVYEQEPTEVCVTIPARFGHNERVLTRQAVIDAGIPESAVVIQNEPTVAAICYGEDFAKEGKRRVLVYDLGGGTFDLSIVEINNGSYTVKCHEGDPNLGGADFDRLILKWVESKYENDYRELLFPSSMPERLKGKYINKYLYDIEEYKKQLSFVESVEMSFSFIPKYKPASVDEDEESFSYDMTLNDLNAILNDEIEKTINMVCSLLNKHQMMVSDIDGVILVGGSSRLKIVEERLGELFGKDKLKYSVNPDECVAKGALYYLMNKVNIKEVTSKSLGIELSGNRVKCIIPAQTSLPTIKTVVVRTTRDNQMKVTSKVIQNYQENENDIAPIDESCVILHEFEWSGFQIRPKQEVIFEIAYAIDEFGILSVRVIEKKTDKVLINNLSIAVQEL